MQVRKLEKVQQKEKKKPEKAQERKKKEQGSENIKDDQQTKKLTLVEIIKRLLNSTSQPNLLRKTEERCEQCYGNEGKATTTKIKSDENTKTAYTNGEFHRKT